MSSADILELGKTHPEFEPIWESVKDQMPPLHGDLKAVRELLVSRKKALAASHGAKFAGLVTQENFTVPARDGFEIPCVLYKPSSPPSKGSPLVILLHGGGFVAGETINEELNCQLFASRLGCTCVNVDYRLAPEYPFPYSQNDAWDATKWVAGNPTFHGANLELGFIVAGTSAGGCLTDVVGHLARDEKLSPPLTGLLEMIPALIPLGSPPDKYKADYLAWEQNKDAPVLPRITIDWMMDQYKPDFASPLAFPFINAHGHAGMPPVYFQVCGQDPLRDDALIYERVLREEHGVQTRLKMYPGVPHGWWSVWPDMELSKQFVEDTVEGIEWLLSLVGK